MPSRIVILLFFSGLVACGGSSGLSVQAACESLLTARCEMVHRCFKEEIKKDNHARLFWGETVTECVGILENGIEVQNPDYNLELCEKDLDKNAKHCWIQSKQDGFRCAKKSEGNPSRYIECAKPLRRAKCSELKGVNVVPKDACK